MPRHKPPTFGDIVAWLGPYVVASLVAILVVAILELGGA